MSFAAEIGQGISNAFEQVARITKGVSSGTFTVTKDNVLAAGKIIESHVDSLQDRWRDSRHDIRIIPPGDDDVSAKVADAWNDLLLNGDDSFQRRVADYIVGLRKLTVQLADTAKAYGYTEEEISAAFGNTRA